MPEWTEGVRSSLFAAVPSELYVRATRARSAPERGTSAGPTLGLTAGVLALHGLALLAFTRLLDSPSSMGPRSAGRAEAWGLRHPGAVPGRVRGRRSPSSASRADAARTFDAASPFLVFGVFAVVLKRSGGMDLGSLSITSGQGLATFGCAMYLLSILPFAMNQFAIDGAGLTLELLSPLGDADILSGKMAGIGLIVFVPACLCLAVAFTLFPAGPTALWISIPIGLAATYLLVAPLAALLSALFPRAVDLNSIGRGSNAHGVGGSLGLVAFALAPCPASP